MATIYDVAKLAEVSHTAVSAVINNKPISLKESTKVRIRDAAKALGYEANRAARQLSVGKFNTVALCFAEVGTYIFKSIPTNQLISGVVNCASENNLSLLLPPTQRAYTFEEMIAKLPSQGVDGAIIIGPIPLATSNASAISRCSISLVCIDPNPALASVSTVDTDGFVGIRMGVEHLISKGHKKMAYISPMPEYQCFVDRMRGFYQAVQDAGLSLADQMTHILPLEDVPAVVRQSVATTNGPTALICAEEQTTCTVLDEAVRLGLRIPGDLSILGYDDVPGHALWNSTDFIRNDFFRMGAAATDLIWKLTNGKCSGPVSLRLSPELLLHTS